MERALFLAVNAAAMDKLAPRWISTHLKGTMFAGPHRSCMIRIVCVVVLMGAPAAFAQATLNMSQDLVRLGIASSSAVKADPGSE